MTTLLRDEMAGMTAAEKAAHIVRNWREVDGTERLLRIMITDALNDHAVTGLDVVRKEERERCARIADSFAIGAEALALDAVLRPGSLKDEKVRHQAARQQAENIAAKIRLVTP